MHHFTGNPLEADEYCYVNKLDLVLPDSERDTTELISISDVVDLMVEVACSESVNTYQICLPLQVNHGRVELFSLIVFWDAHELSWDAKPRRSFAGFNYYHVTITLNTIASPGDLLTLTEFLTNPVIAFTDYESLSASNTLN